LSQAWPEDALEMVANKFLEEVDMEDDVRLSCVILCKHFHESVRMLSIRSVTLHALSYTFYIFFSTKKKIRHFVYLLTQRLTFQIL
jgi:hypothetical protein